MKIRRIRVLMAKGWCKVVCFVSFSLLSVICNHASAQKEGDMTSGVVRVDEALQGRVPGLDIIFESGDLAYGPPVRSLMKKIDGVDVSKPLVVLDFEMREIDEAKLESSDFEYVDLGLSVKWCTCNVGAATPLDEGYLYKWNHNWNDNGIWNVFADNVFVKGEGDIAKLQRGEDWRTPSNDEMIELLSYCTFTWVDNADSCGFKVTSNIEGFTDSSIFIPVQKTKVPIYEIVNTSNGGHYLNPVDSSYHYTGNYMTDFIKDSYRPGFLRTDGGGTFMMFKEAQLFLEDYYIRPVRPLDPVTQQNRVLPQVELRETNIVYGEPGDIDMSEFEGLGEIVDDGLLQW